MHQVTLLSLARIFHKPWKRHYSVFAPHLSPTILRAGLAVGGLRNRRATRPPAHFQRNPPGRGRWLFFRVARPNPYDSDMDALLSSKFQVVIPRSVRNRLGLRPGVKLQVIEYHGQSFPPLKKDHQQPSANSKTQSRGDEKV
jgi:AbrB family looped-hinge helix DNA binding protein